MKKTILIFTLALISMMAFGQTRARKGLTVGDERVSGTLVTLIDSITVDGTTVHMYHGATDLGLGVGAMTYPGAGIAVSNGSAWQTSIQNSAQLASNISDETGTGVLVFGTSPAFTTSITIGAGTITAAEAGYIDPTSSIQTQLNARVEEADTAAMLTPYIHRGDTAAMLTPYIQRTDTAAMLANYALLSEATGDVTKVGTPVDDQVGIWTGDGTIEGDVDLTFDGDSLIVDGKVTADYFEIGSARIMEAELEILDGALWSTTEGNYLVGLASNIIEAADTAAMLAPYIHRSDTSAMLTPYINRADTAAMLAPYINRADTAAMLTPYISRADTAAMLTPYINRADTASMLSPYVRTVGTPVDGQLGIWTGDGTIEGDTSVTFDGNRLNVISTTSNYPLRAARPASSGASTGVGFDLYNSNGTYITYAGIKGWPITATAGSEDGVMYFHVMSNGALVNPFSVDTLGALANRVRFNPISSISNPAEGDVYYDTEDDSLYLRVNTSWVGLNREAGGGAGGGDVSKVGTPVDNQVGVWTGDGTIEGDANFTWDGDTLEISSVANLDGVLIKEDSIFLRGSDTDSYFAQNDANQYTLRLAGKEIWTAYGDGDNFKVEQTLVVTDSTHMGGSLDIDGNFIIGAADISETELEILDGATLTTDELNYVDGVSSAIQDQLDLKAPLANAALTGSTTAEDIETEILAVGQAGNMVTLDSITSESSDVKFYDGADTLAPYTPYAARTEISTIAVMLADSNTYDGGYATPTWVDTQVAAGSGTDSVLMIATGEAGLASGNIPYGYSTQGDNYTIRHTDSLDWAASGSVLTMKGSLGQYITRYAYSDESPSLIGNEDALLNRYYRTGGNGGSISAAPTDALINGNQYYIYDGTSYEYGLRERIVVDGAISTSDFDVTKDLYFRDGASDITTTNGDWNIQFNKTGITLGDDYSASWTDSSLVDKKYVDDIVEDTVDIEAISPLLTDVNFMTYQFGAGMGIAGDTALMNTNNDLGFGHIKVQEDSLEITRYEYYITSGDTIEFYIVYGSDYGNNTTADTIDFVQCEDDAMTAVTAGFDEDTIPEGNYIWLDVSAVTATRKPILFRVDLYGYIKRD